MAFSGANRPYFIFANILTVEIDILLHILWTKRKKVLFCRNIFIEV